MRNHWIYFYWGIVTVKATGTGLERFINRLTRNGVLIWDVKKHGLETMTFKMSLKDMKELKQAVRNSGCKVKFLKRTGLPFLIRRLFKNSGFFVGAVLF